jgi:hypothetical protein
MDYRLSPRVRVVAGEVALTGLVKVLPSQVEYGRKLVMLSLVWMQ